MDGKATSVHPMPEKGSAAVKVLNRAFEANDAASPGQRDAFWAIKQWIPRFLQHTGCQEIEHGVLMLERKRITVGCAPKAFGAWSSTFMERRRKKWANAAAIALCKRHLIYNSFTVLLKATLRKRRCRIALLGWRHTVVWRRSRAAQRHTATEALRLAVNRMAIARCLAAWQRAALATAVHRGHHRHKLHDTLEELRSDAKNRWIADTWQARTRKRRVWAALQAWRLRSKTLMRWYRIHVFGRRAWLHFKEQIAWHSHVKLTQLQTLKRKQQRHQAVAAWVGSGLRHGHGTVDGFGMTSILHTSRLSGPGRPQNLMNSQGMQPVVDETSRTVMKETSLGSSYLQSFLSLKSVGTENEEKGRGRQGAIQGQEPPDSPRLQPEALPDTSADNAAEVSTVPSSPTPAVKGPTRNPYNTTEAQRFRMRVVEAMRRQREEVKHRAAKAAPAPQKTRGSASPSRRVVERPQSRPDWRRKLKAFQRERRGEALQHQRKEAMRRFQALTGASTPDALQRTDDEPPCSTLSAQAAAAPPPAWYKHRVARSWEETASFAAVQRMRKVLDSNGHIPGPTVVLPAVITVVPLSRGRTSLLHFNRQSSPRGSDNASDPQLETLKARTGPGAQSLGRNGSLADTPFQRQGASAHASHKSSIAQVQPKAAAPTAQPHTGSGYGSDGSTRSRCSEMTSREPVLNVVLPQPKQEVEALPLLTTPDGWTMPAQCLRPTTTSAMLNRPTNISDAPCTWESRDTVVLGPNTPSHSSTCAGGTAWVEFEDLVEPHTPTEREAAWAESHQSLPLVSLKNHLLTEDLPARVIQSPKSLAVDIPFLSATEPSLIELETSSQEGSI